MIKQRRKPNECEIKKELEDENERLWLDNEALNIENISFDHENIPLKKEPKQEIKAELDDDGIEIVEEIKKVILEFRHEASTK